MTYLHAVILGIVEGITEFLPVSSTGHLILTNAFLGHTSELSKTFDIAIQSGAMFAVFVVTRREWLKREVWTRVLAGFVPTAAIGFLVYKSVKAYLLTPWVVVIALALGGLLMLAFEYWKKPTSERGTDGMSIEGVSHVQAATIGVVQALAVIPGVSRSAATVLGGMALGLPRSTVVLYSFLLAVPTIGAATVYDLWKQRELLATSNEWGALAVGMGVSALVAGLVIRWFLRYIRRHSFIVFACERLIVAGVAWWVLLR